jgi:hypothetical protein
VCVCGVTDIYCENSTKQLNTFWWYIYRPVTKTSVKRLINQILLDNARNIPYLVRDSFQYYSLCPPVFCSGFPSKVLYPFITVVMRATCLTCFIVLCLVVLILHGEKYKSWNFTSCAVLHSAKLSLFSVPDRQTDRQTDSILFSLTHPQPVFFPLFMLGNCVQVLLLCVQERDWSTEIKREASGCSSPVE